MAPDIIATLKIAFSWLEFLCLTIKVDQLSPVLIFRNQAHGWHATSNNHRDFRRPGEVADSWNVSRRPGVFERVHFIGRNLTDCQADFPEAKD